MDMYEALTTESTWATDQTRLELAKQSRGGPNVEPPTAALFKRLVNDKSETIAQMVQDVAELRCRMGFSIGSIATALRINIIDYCTEREKLLGRKFCDLDRTSPADWDEPIEWVKQALESPGVDLTDPFVELALRLKNSGIYMPPGTSPLYRGNGAELLGQLLSERWPDGARGLDIGSSSMVTPLSHVYKDALTDEALPAFEFTEIKTKDQSLDLTDKANRILQRRSIFREFVCVDIHRVYKEDLQAFDDQYKERSINALRPSERADDKYIATINALHAKKDKDSPDYDQLRRVKFAWANLLDDPQMFDFKDKHPGLFDFININFVTQELPFSEFIQLFQAAWGLLSENGILNIVHQARVKQGSLQRPVSIAKVRPYIRYATYPWRSTLQTVDALNTDSYGVQTMMEFYDNRCRRARTTAGRLVVNGALEPLSDLIKNS